MQRNLPSFCLNRLDPTSVILFPRFLLGKYMILMDWSNRKLCHGISCQTDLVLFSIFFSFSVLLPTERDIQYQNPAISSQCSLWFMAGKDFHSISAKFLSTFSALRYNSGSDLHCEWHLKHLDDNPSELRSFPQSKSGPGQFSSTISWSPWLLEWMQKEPCPVFSITNSIPARWFHLWQIFFFFFIRNKIYIYILIIIKVQEKDERSSPQKYRFWSK